MYTRSHLALQLVDSFSKPANKSGLDGYTISLKYMNTFAQVCEYVKYTIPPFGGVVFASDILHAGVANPGTHCTMRGFCQFQGSDSLGFKLVDVVVSKLHIPRGNDDQDNVSLMVRHLMV